jgi:hypothetical protein
MGCRAVLGAAISATTLGAQDTSRHRVCRDPHPVPLCRSYFLFEYGAAARVTGTTVARGYPQQEPALDSWFAWDIGWMRNQTPRYGFGAAAEIGGSGDGVRLALRARARRWLTHDYVVDVSAGPLMSQLQTKEGEIPTYGATGEFGVGRARVLLVTAAVDMARQNGSMQHAMHVGGRAESRAAAIISILAAAGGLLVVASLSSGHY